MDDSAALNWQEFASAKSNQSASIKIFCIFSGIVALLFGVFGNGIILHILLFSKHLRAKRENYFFVAMLTLNGFLMSLVVVPISTVGLASGKVHFLTCSSVAYIFLFLFTTQAPITLIALIIQIIGLCSKKARLFLLRPTVPLIVVFLCVILFAAYMWHQVEQGSKITFDWNPDYGACIHNTDAFEERITSDTRQGRHLLAVEYANYAIFLTIALCAMILVGENIALKHRSSHNMNTEKGETSTKDGTNSTSSLKYRLSSEKGHNILALAIAKGFLTFPFLLVAATNEPALQPIRAPVLYITYLHAALPCTLLTIIDPNIRRALYMLFSMRDSDTIAVWSNPNTAEKGSGSHPLKAHRLSGSQGSRVHQWVDQIIRQDHSGATIGKLTIVEPINPPDPTLVRNIRNSINAERLASLGNQPYTASFSSFVRSYPLGIRGSLEKRSLL